MVDTATTEADAVAQKAPSAPASGPRKYTPEEARKIVDETWDIALGDAFKRVWEHPFTRELDAGTLPIECVRGFVSNWYTAAQEINAASAAGYYASRAFYSQFPDLDESRAEGIADEFTAPGPGGHQRTIEGIAKALGVGREELVNYPLIPEARAYLDTLVIFLAYSRGGGDGININEERLAEWFKIWSRSLVENYGLTADDVYYFTMHAEADSRGEHYGGPTLDSEVMGHADRNRDVARRTLEAGMGPAEPLRVWPQIAKSGTDMFLLLLDGCYERYYPKDRARPA
jgi:pyrroloquinoline quinone (PQQ) biosynthesis protein C